MISLHEAVRRILTSDAEREGPDARCVVLVDGIPGYGVEDLKLDDFRQMLEGFGPDSFDGEVFRIERSLKNWQIKHGDTVNVQVYPWDDSPNVAKLITKAAVVGPDPEALRGFADDLRDLATRFERARLFPEAYAIVVLEAQFLTRHELPAQHAQSELARLQGVLRSVAAQGS